MTNVLMIPEDAVTDLRDGLLLEMDIAVDDLDQLLSRRDRERHAEWFDLVRKRLESIFAAIDLVGWQRAQDGGELAVDLADHGSLVKEAIECQLAALEALLEEVDVSDAWRAKQGMPPRKQELITRKRAVKRLISQLHEALSRPAL